ncbi:Abi family protein (plasmid) [Fusobacterium vincentii]|uniref:Abi family protein n=1 Tax=Fusobacterium TaxID=848 RepID=UPI001EEDB096|nr:Abi family protein [Fusobacterium nucleatum]MCG6836204.1 Abi family protein [Fusobacterium nucleatum]
MGCTETHLTYDEQLEKFISRGMIVKNRDKAIERLKHISYYKIKQFSMFFMDNNRTYKSNTSFEAVVQNFYFDKNLRMEFLKCSEKIELSIKNKIAYLLGAKYGAFGYLKFSSWCDRSIPKNEVQEEEKKFKKKIQNKMKIFSDNSIVKDFVVNNPSETYLSIWRLSEVPTFGEALYLFDMMSQQNKVSIARSYNLKVDEFTSYINNIKLVRNLCAHNMAIINLKLKTIPKINNDFLKIIDKPNKIFTSILIMVYFIKNINSKYNFKNLYHTVCQLIKRKEVAKRYGIKSCKLLKQYIKNKKIF